MTTKSKAIKWWNDLSNDDKIWVMEKAGYLKKHPKELTGKDIEQVWRFAPDGWGYNEK